MDLLTPTARDIFLHWLEQEVGCSYRLPAADASVASDGQHELAITVCPLFTTGGDPAWALRCEAVATQLRELSAAPVTLWIPPDADLPHGDRTDFLQRVVSAAAPLLPGDRGQVEFSVTLTLKKLSNDASYVHVVGGLAPHWARLTGRAFGQYSLDTRAIHRLPEPEQRVAELLEWVVLLGNGMKAGTTSDMKAEDAWSIYRPAFGEWTTLIGAPPGSDPTNGTSVRKLLRDGLRNAAKETTPLDTRRALVLVGLFRNMVEENATIALRSCDPSLYAGFDVVCLVADATCKALVGPRRGRLAPLGSDAAASARGLESSAGGA